MLDNYDVVIVGGGLSGFAAATEAADKNLKTLLVEKGHTTGGTGNYVEGIFAVQSQMQKEAGISIKPESILQTELDYSHYEANGLIWKKYIEQSAENVTWLQQHGVKFMGVVNMGTGFATWHLFEGYGDKAIHNALEPYIKSKGIEIKTLTQATEITQTETGEFSLKLVNVSDKSEQTVLAKNIVLASGGYLNNKELMKHAHKYNPQKIVAVNSGKSTGDGLKLAWSLGARKFFTGMTMNFGGQIYDETNQVPAYELSDWNLGSAVCDEPVLWVNENGDRFVNEYACVTNWANEGNSMLRQDRIFAIFDQKTIDDFTNKQFPLDLHPFYELPNYPNLKREIKTALDKKLSFITKSETISDLAEKLNTPNLQRSIARYNHFSEIGSDNDFGKSAEYLLPVKEGPFYALEMQVGAFTTGDGLKVNLKNEVIDTNGKAIKHLYAIGSDGSGVIYGDTYGVEVSGTHAGYCVYSARNAIDDITK